jgi:hypothetical protein
MAGQKKLHTATVASQKKTINNLTRKTVVSSPSTPSPPRPAKGNATASVALRHPNRLQKLHGHVERRSRLENPPSQIRRSERKPGQQLAGAATSGLAEIGIELWLSYSDATPPPPS